MTCQIDLYAGLLGCGKTTLIKKLLETEYKGKKVAIIENEIGAVNLDTGELSAADISVKEITNGCVCCTIQGEFTRAIDMLVESEQPDYIIIEPTGAADIRGLLSACQKVHTAALRRCIMLVNAKKLVRLLKVVGPFYHDQIGHSSCVYLNFTENMTEEQLLEAKEALLSINPKVTLVDTPLADISADTFAGAVFAETSELSSFTKKGGPSLTVRTVNSGAPVRMMVPGRSQETLYTCTLELEHPLTDEQFIRLKSMLTDTAHCDIWRAKGIIPLTSGERKRLDLTFGDLFENAAKAPAEEADGKLVLIGKKLDTACLTDQLHSL